MDREQRYPVSVGSSDPLFSEDEFRRAHELRDAGKPLYEAQWQARSERVAALEAELEEAKREAAENMEALLDERDRSMKWVKSHGALATELADAKAQVKELQEALRRIATRDVDAKRPEARAWDYEQVAAAALAGSMEEQRYENEQK